MGKISLNDEILIENLRIEKKWSSIRLLSEFPSKGWPRSGVDSLLSGSAKREVGSGRLKLARTAAGMWAHIEHLFK